MRPSQSSFTHRRMRPRSRRNNVIRTWWAIFALPCLFFGAAIGWYIWALQPVDSGSQARRNVVVSEGESLTEIAAQLHEQKLIRSAQAFLLYMQFQSRANTLQAGNVIMNASMTVPDIVDVLQSGKAEEIAITIPEGYTVFDIDALLAKRGIIKPGELVDCANRCDFSTFNFLPQGNNLADRGGKVEGYLFPDTYFVLINEFVPKFFLERMLGTFRKRVVNVYSAQLEEKNITLHELTTMASLVEKESKKGDERPIIAGILWKRLNQNMRLDADASVRYIINKPTSAITRADLQIDSPYNSRKYGDLPPGPIASPGIESIEATLHPVKTNYYYYLHAPSGQAHFAITNYEHNLNKQRYLY